MVIGQKWTYGGNTPYGSVLAWYGISVAPRSLGLGLGLPQVIAFPLLLFDYPKSNSTYALLS